MASPDIADDVPPPVSGPSRTMKPPPAQAFPQPNPGNQGIALMLLSLVLFTGNVLILRGISLREPRVDGLMATVWRGAIGVAMVLAVFRGRGLRASHIFTRPLVVLRGVTGAVGILCFYHTIPALGAGHAVVLNLTFPLFGAVLAAVFLHEPLRGRQVGWLLAGLAGLLLFLSGEPANTPAGHAPWIGLGGAVIAGVAVVLIRALHATESTATIYASQAFWTLVIALPLAGPALPDLPPRVVPALVAASLLVAGGQLALTQAFRSLSVARGSALQMLGPLLIAGGGALLYGERFNPVELAGGALTLVATWQVVRPGPEATAPAGSARPVPADCAPAQPGHGEHPSR